MVVGGTNSHYLASYELFNPGLSRVPALQPRLTGVSLASSALAAVSSGSSETVSGEVVATGFMPLLEASGGATNNSAGNAPTFQVQRVDNGQMAFIPNDETQNMGDTHFTGSPTAFAGFPPGPLLVRAWVNGIPSTAVYARLVADDVILRDGFETSF
jgi:hypothetical protein